MGRLLVTVAGTFAFVCGGVVLLYLLPWLFLRHPCLHGEDYLLGVVQEALKPRPFGAAAVGLGLVLAGLSSA